MALEIFPPAATLSAGESQSFEAREGGTRVAGVVWSIAPGHKGKIDPATGVYSSPPMPVFVTKDVTIVARKSSAPAEFGAATAHVSCAHSWIVLIAAYLVFCAAGLSWWGYEAWGKAFPTKPAQTKDQAAGEQQKQSGSQQQAQTGGQQQNQAGGQQQAQAGGEQQAQTEGQQQAQTGGEQQVQTGGQQQTQTPSQGNLNQTVSASQRNEGAGGPSDRESDQRESAEPGQPHVLALLQLILIFGAGGALVHAVRSLYGYVGNKQFEPNWAPFYFARPFEGGFLALLTIFMFEGSLIEIEPNGISLTDGWAVCGIAGLVGLFTDKALLKLGQIFDAVLTPPADTRGGKLTTAAALAPVLAKLTPEKAAAGSEATEVQLAGDHFESDASALVNGSARATVFQSAKSLSFTLTKADLSQAATLKISVKGKSAASNELDFTVEP